MAARKALPERSTGEDAALLVAALEHSWAWYDSRMNRGLQVINYFLIAIAVLATAYVSAINGKHYPIAAVIALAGAVLTAITFMVGIRQWRMAIIAEASLADIEGRIADKLTLGSFRMVAVKTKTRVNYYAIGAFTLALFLSAGSVWYAIVH